MLVKCHRSNIGVIRRPWVGPDLHRILAGLQQSKSKLCEDGCLYAALVAEAGASGRGHRANGLDQCVA